MQNTANSLLTENREKNGGSHSVSHPFVRTNGIMTKATTMDAIKNFGDLNGKGAVLAKVTYRSVVDPVLVTCPTLDTPV